MTLGCVYKDPNAPVEERVRDLLPRMTLEEKIGLKTQIERLVATPFVVTQRFIGSLLSGGGSKPSENAASEQWPDMIDGFQKATLETRLGIPILYGIDAVHRNNNVYGATIFPHNIGLGATRLVEILDGEGAMRAMVKTLKL